MAATALVRLGKLTGRSTYVEAGERTLRAAAGLLQQAPTAMGQMLLALDLYLGPTFEMVLTGDARNEETRTARREVHRRFMPNKVLAAALADNQEKPPGLLKDLLAGKAPSGTPVLYVCEGFTCQEPAEGAKAIAAKLGELSRADLRH
jgi:uncharacterized protein